MVYLTLLSIHTLYVSLSYHVLTSDVRLTAAPPKFCVVIKTSKLCNFYRDNFPYNEKL
jgi:hypothetical protein